MTSHLKEAIGSVEYASLGAEERAPDPQCIVSSGQGRIRPRARLIRTIGAELISSEVVAVLELVRNSYDADAQRVEIRFTNPHRPEAALLEIVDDGHGMTEEILLGPWLEPATSHKSQNSTGLLAGERSPSGRRRLGSKGVGRFATQRLGHHLLVRSRSLESPNELEAEFNWERLDNVDQYLDELRIPWKKLRARAAMWHGTSLRLTRLRDNWDEERFDRLRLALSRLQGPGLADDFAIFININGTLEEITPFIDTLPAMYSIDGSVCEGGVCKIIYRDITGAEESWERTVLWPLSGTCGPFRFRINSWDLDKEAVLHFLRKIGSSTGPRDLRRAIRIHSGISLYRDSFRILPYGEPDNDWLRLDRRRVNNPTLRLSNNQILGWIRLTADANPLLQDQTNREGLVTNEAYVHLQQIILELLSYLESRRFAARRALGLAARSILKSSGPKDAESVKDIEELLSGISPTDLPLKASIVSELRQVVSTIQETTLSAVSSYSAMAGVGLLSSKIIAQLEHPLKQALGEAEFLRAETLASEMPIHLKADLSTSAEKLLGCLRQAVASATTITAMALLPDQQKAAPVRLANCIETVANLYLEEFVCHAIDFQLQANANPEIVASPSLIYQVITLILDNATFWVREIKGERLIRARVYTGGFIIENNGPQIPKGMHEKIFDPFFTTREGAAGLGLTLARNLLKTIDGILLSVKTSLGTGFEVRLPRKA